MKKLLLSFVFMFTLATVFTGCRDEKNDDVEDVMDDMEDDAEDLADDMEDAVDD